MQEEDVEQNAGFTAIVRSESIHEYFEKKKGLFIQFVYPHLNFLV